MFNQKHFAARSSLFSILLSLFSILLFMFGIANAHRTEEASTYHIIYEHVIQTNCTSSSCHSTAKPSGGLNLENEDVAYEGLVGADSENFLAEEQGLKRIEPYYPESSLLMFKLTRPMDGHGDLMPRGGKPLPRETVDAIRRWVVAGAPKKGTIKDMPALDAPIKFAREAFEPPSPPERGFQAYLPPFEILPGGEREILYAMKLPITEDVLVNRIDIIQPTGSHHFLLYRILGDKTPESGHRELVAQDRGHDGIDRELVAGAQTMNTTLEYPEGIGIKIYADTYYDFNSHYINLNQKETLHGEVYVNFHTVDASWAKRIAHPFLISNGDINVPPGERVETTDTWIVPQDIELVVLASHMHRHGERFVVARLDGKPIYQTDDWEDPGYKMFNPPLLFKRGDGLRYTATHYNGDKPYPIRFGYTSEDEMSIIFGYAVPVK